MLIIAGNCPATPLFLAIACFPLALGFVIEIPSKAFVFVIFTSISSSRPRHLLLPSGKALVTVVISSLNELNVHSTRCGGPQNNADWDNAQAERNTQTQAIPKRFVWFAGSWDTISS
ncbi:hypothetical protein EX30DRAFT_348669 [Ascodesmis nigricans]|uniref:Uncharacterized protein n=1 Tax=Ascodesmis nigricans TaxID=341454 RepID=A0A4S2MXV8_9PEZI|nr:hypothetical protein EX30DRAFT_348669 [Ascodesmis nigricans]